MLVELKQIVIVKKSGGDSNVAKLKQVLSLRAKARTKYQIDLLPREMRR